MDDLIDTEKQLKDEAKTQGQINGGHARAAALSPKRRKEIAAKAAGARWDPSVPRATRQGEIELGGIRIPCAVLESGQRVLTQQGFYRAMGRSGSPAKGWGSQIEQVAPFLALKSIKRYVSDELGNSSKPIIFRPTHGSMKAFGYDAELLPRVCEVYLRAREAGALLPAQLKFAKACEILVRGLSYVGIKALIDEATGYQELRDKTALQAILDKHLRKEFAEWSKRFPDEFYKQIFRLRGWTWKGMHVNRPQYVGQITTEFVYARLTPGILRELKAKTPKPRAPKGPDALHQWLTADVGHRELSEHLHAVVGIMRVADSWDQFVTMMDRAFPKKGDTIDVAALVDMPDEDMQKLKKKRKDFLFIPDVPPVVVSQMRLPIE